MVKEYCVSLELAKEMKNKNFPQIKGILYSWDKEEELTTYEYQNEILGVDDKKNLDLQGLIRRPTAGEIILELPAFIEWKGNPYQLNIVKNDVAYIAHYGTVFMVNRENLSEALGQLWVYLKQNGMINE